MRILHLVHRSHPFHGGAERYVLEHALASSRWGHESVIATTDAWDISLFADRKAARIPKKREMLGDVEILRFRVVHPPLSPLLRASLRRLLPGGPDRFFHPNPFIPSLGRYLTPDRGFAFVHANAMPFLIYQGFRHARAHGCGMAAAPHANIGERFRRLSDIRYFAGMQPGILSSCSFAVAQSRFEEGLFLEMGVLPERIHISGSGIEPTEFESPDIARARRRLGFDGPYVLSMTSHCADRGTGHLLEASKSLWRAGLDFVLVLAGPVAPGFRADLESALGDVEPGRVVLTGYVDRDERAGIIAGADVVALPSRLDCFGIILLEAWACGRPVIGSWAGAMPDMVDDGRNGFLVPFGDAVTLADRMARLLGNPGMRSSMGALGRVMVMRERTWRKVTDRFYGRLSECIRPGEGRP
ncbi:MAG: glycosyltransferase family 4 protein [Candidatus Fermentibacter sp.]|nr:glycosyltransferase family 4 protein [Candidatus Fermentibacter sp.]